jgi:hypothetical protein
MIVLLSIGNIYHTSKNKIFYVTYSIMTSYYIPPSFENIVWPAGQEPDNPSNIGKYLHADTSGNVIWKFPSTFNIMSFSPIMRVYYDFTDESSYTNLNTVTGTFTQISDKSPNARHTTTFLNILFYPKNSVAAALNKAHLQFRPKSVSGIGRHLTMNNNPFPSSPSTRFYAVFVLKFFPNDSTNSGNDPFLYLPVSSSIEVKAFQNFTSQGWIKTSGSGSNYTASHTLSSWRDFYSIVIVENNGSSHSIWFNGLQASGSNASSLSYPSSCRFFGVSTDPNPENNVYAYFAHMMIIEGESCIDANRQRIEGYFCHLLNGNGDVLPNTHPYKFGAP